MQLIKLKVKSIYPRKIRPRLTLAFIMIVIILIVPLSLWIYHLQKESLISSYKNTVSQRTLLIANSAGLRLFQYKFSNFQRLIDNLKSNEHVVMAKLIDNTGKILAHSETGLVETYSSDSLSVRAMRLAYPDVYKTFLPGKGDVVCVIIPLFFLDNTYIQNSYAPNHTLITIYSLDQVYEVLNRWKTKLFGIGIVGIIVGLILAFFLAKTITSPLLKLHQGVKRITAGDMNYQIQELPGQKKMDKNEITELTQSFNLMVRHLNQMIEEKIKKQSLVTLGEFATLIIHHLKNPLYGVYTWVDIMWQYLSHKDPSIKTRAFKDGLQNISQAIKKMDAFIKNTLDFAKPFLLELKPANLEKIIEDVLVSVPLNESIRVVKQFDGQIKQLNLDLPKFSMALSCLINNAVEAMPSGGTLTIKTLLSSKIRISISDTGSGIKSEDLSKIFNPFYTTKERGDGMGLMFVKKIIESHGATIKVTSEEGKGSDFQIILPINLLISDNIK